MTLAAGSLVGPYEIVSLRGAGGMGEVYRARDTRLERTVAIKVLPPGLSEEEQLRARFEREARAISALSHPNICTVYDVGSDNGTEYLVMEYLEGETLSERLARGPLPASLVLRYGAQIAEGLQHAHRAGITHRDLKPGNVMITDAGAKLLDFGLAKFIEAPPRVHSDLSAPATRQGPITTEGTIVGTMHYMSPEQLEGKHVDSRTDIFSLGVLLYEMSTGQRPFDGDSPASLIAAILSSDPTPARVRRPDLSPALDRIILTSIEKNPNERWQTAHDVALQLRWISESSHTAEQGSSPGKHRLPIAGVILATAAVAGAITWAAISFVVPPNVSSESVTRLQLVLPPDIEFSAHPELASCSISPDGRSIIIRGVSNGSYGLFLRDLDSYQVARLEGTEGAVAPFWSSDGKWIGFSLGGKLWKTQKDGGSPPQAICEVSKAGARATWQQDTILFSDSRGDHTEIYRVASGGGVPESVTTIEPNEFRHSWPTLLADGNHFLYLSFASTSIERKLRLASLDTRAEADLLSNISHASLSSTDSIVYVRDGKLLEQKFDIKGARMIGDPNALADDVSYFYPTARAVFDSSPSGVVVYRTDTSTGRLVVRNRNGIETQTLQDGLNFWDHAISPDGKRAAVSLVARGTGLMDIWIYDLSRGVRDRFTSDPAIEVSPAWTPDGQAIVYSEGAGGSFPHLVFRKLTSSTSEELTPMDSFQMGPSFSPDGKTIYYESDSGTGNRIYKLSLETREREPLIKTEFSEFQAQASPDGKWIAFASNATGAPEVYLQNLTDPADRIRISNTGGLAPHWRRDSRELFYVTYRGEVMSALPGPTGRWSDAKITMLFRHEASFRGFDVAPDGQSFLISDWTPGSSDGFLHVILRTK